MNKTRQPSFSKYPKYTLDYTDKKFFIHNEKEHTLYRVVYRYGFKGGYIESYENLSQEGGSMALDCAMVLNNARVRDNAQIRALAVICDNAKAVDNSVIDGKSIVCNNALIADNARIGGETKVCNDTVVRGNIHLFDGHEISLEEIQKHF